MGRHRLVLAVRVAALAVVVFVVGGAVPGSVARAATREASASTTTRLSSTQAYVDRLVASVRDAAAARDGLQIELAGLFADLDANRRALERANGLASGTRAAIDALTAQIDAHQRAFDERAVAIYTAGPGLALAMMLGASSAGDLQDRLEIMAAASEGDRALIESLNGRRRTLDEQRRFLGSLQVGLQGIRDRLDADAASLTSKLAEERDAIARLGRERAAAERLIATLKAQRRRELAEEALRQAAEDTLTASRAARFPPPLEGSATVREIIVRYFTPLGQATLDRAMCVAYRESGFDASAVNVSSHASGVFQFMPAVWPPISEEAGWGGASVFDPEANVAVAAWTVAHYGWSPWKSDSETCGI